ncbi:hypothetical protein [Nocardioides sp. ChNu-99]|uniref:hypothetical protein n=1 Tax=Nocardioides sp. ChNu-99 TaxID=2839897 RepID=UPI002406F165|nr:hypothetical protein [Nocardioides sp. ChNu-99]MDF9716485.1 hypothetical protein [Nocardioides sp. ChNu-99]
MARSAQVTARERAREAVRRREAERAARERQVHQELTNYFAGEEKVDEGTRLMSEAVSRLIDELGESPADVAALLDVEVREVNRLKRAVASEVDAAPASASGQSDNSAGGGGGKDDSEATAQQGDGDSTEHHGAPDAPESVPA